MTDYRAGDVVNGWLLLPSLQWVPANATLASRAAETVEAQREDDANRVWASIDLGLETPEAYLLMLYNIASFIAWGCVNAGGLNVLGPPVVAEGIDPMIKSGADMVSWGKQEGGREYVLAEVHQRGPDNVRSAAYALSRFAAFATDLFIVRAGLDLGVPTSSSWHETLTARPESRARP